MGHHIVNHKKPVSLVWQLQAFSLTSAGQAATSSSTSTCISSGQESSASYTGCTPQNTGKLMEKQRGTKGENDDSSVDGMVYPSFDSVASLVSPTETQGQFFTELREVRHHLRHNCHGIEACSETNDVQTNMTNPRCTSGFLK